MSSGGARGVIGRTTPRVALVVNRIYQEAYSPWVNVLFTETIVVSTFTGDDVRSELYYRTPMVEMFGGITPSAAKRAGVADVADLTSSWKPVRYRLQEVPDVALE